MNDNGSRQLRSFVRVFDSLQVVRDVTTSFDDQWRPTDAFVRLTCAEDHVGSGWYLFEAHQARFRGWTKSAGYQSIDLPTDGPAAGFNAHSVAGEAALLAVYDHSSGVQIQHPDGCFVSTEHPRGASGPSLFKAHFGIRFVGEEQLTVGAGTFTALHYQYVDTELVELPPDTPAFDMWVTADGELTYLKGDLKGNTTSQYELMSLQETTLP